MRFRSIIAVLLAVAIVAFLVFGLLSKGNSRLQVGEAAPSPQLPLKELLLVALAVGASIVPTATEQNIVPVSRVGVVQSDQLP